MKQQQAKSEHVEFRQDDGAGLLAELLAKPKPASSEFAEIMGHPAILPDQTQEIAVSGPASYLADNSVFSSVHEHAPEPEPKWIRKHSCPYCGRIDCPWAFIGAED